MAEKKVKLVAVQPIGLGGGGRAEPGEVFEVTEAQAARLEAKGVADRPKAGAPRGGE